MMFSKSGRSSSEGRPNVRFRAVLSPVRRPKARDVTSEERSLMSVNSAWKIVSIFEALSGGLWERFSAGKFLIRGL